jgi:membrane peptidoglycan carboxypeptidase
VTSRADDFGVRHDDDDDRRRAARDDYDLGYADNGWDTQGFRTPPGGSRPYDRDTYSGDYDPASAHQSPSPAGGYQSPSPTGGYRTGGANEPYDPYATQFMGAPATQSVGGPATQSIGAAPTGQVGHQITPTRRHARPSGPGGPGGPDGPGGPSGPGGPGGPRRPRGHRGADRVKVKGSWWRHWSLRKVLGLFAVLVGASIVLITLGIIYVYQTTQVPTAKLAAAQDEASVIYASNGSTVIGRIGDANHQVINYNQIPTKIIWSVLAAEDRNFFNEGGVSPSGMLRAAYEDIMNGGDQQGGSTITQEFVRQYYEGIGTDKTMSRKIKEIFVAMKIGRTESKDWILQQYLNTIYLGEGAQGIAAAEYTYFGLPVSKLNNITWSQAALIAAVIQQPSTYPLPQYHSNFVARWQYVVQGLVKMGKITPQAAASLTFPTFGDHQPQTYGNAVWDPYVVDTVESELQEVDGYTMPELEDNGYKIITTVDPTKMNALYSAVQTEENDMAEDGEALQSYMHVGAVLVDPGSAGIVAMYGGPGFVGAKYNGVGKVITQKFCDEISCTLNLALTREQVGSSFKPYILATAVSEGMNVDTSKLDGLNPACIPPDTDPNTYLAPNPGYPGNGCQAGWDPMTNDDFSENGAYTPQQAMTSSINTAYADLWHKVAGPTGQSVVDMASSFGVNVDEADLPSMQDEAGIALGQGSLSVAEQADTLATIDNEGTWNQLHIVKAITLDGANQATKLAPSHLVLDKTNPTMNQEMDSQVQYGMEDVVLAGTGTGAIANMYPSRQVIAKTGTTNTAQSAFFLGAIPQDALAIGMFTSAQCAPDCVYKGHSDAFENNETLNGLGGISVGQGGAWPASIWNAYALQEFNQLPVDNFQIQTSTFTGQSWILAPSSMLKTKAKAKPKKHNNPDAGVTAPPPGSSPSAYPSPTETCPPGQNNVDCVMPSSGTGDGPMQTPTPTASDTGIGGIGIIGETPAADHGSDGAEASTGAAVAGSAVALPLALFWVRKRGRRGNRRGR